MKKSTFLMLLLIPQMLYAAEGIIPGEKLSRERCIDVAVANHPQIIAAQSNLEASRAATSQARSAYMPQLNATANYKKYDQDTSYDTGIAGPFDKYQTGFNMNMTLYDFGRTSSQVDVRKYQAESNSSSYNDIKSQISLGVKQAYFSLLQANDNLDASQATLAKFEQHLEMAKKLYEVGLKPMIDITKAEVDLGQSRLDFIKAQNAYISGKLILANAMGIDEAPAFEILPYYGDDDMKIDEDSALKRAYDNRNDFKSAKFLADAAAKNVRLANAGHYPVLAGTAGYGWTGEEFPLNNEWNAGATLTVPIFTGFNVKYQVHEAQAKLKAQMANVELLKQKIRLDVTQALLNINEVRKRIDVAKKTLSYARQNTDLAEGRYAEGIGNSIEVTDAITSERNSAASYAASIYQMRISIAELEKAMGEIK